MVVHYRPGVVGYANDLLKVGDIFINSNTFGASHCGIMIDERMILHATSDNGVKPISQESWGKNADIFRASPALNPGEAAAVLNVAQEMRKITTYGVARMIGSAFGTSVAAEATMSRLLKYRQRLKMHQGVARYVYCSELVIMCYQLACATATSIDPNNRLFISLDGKHAWPSTLRTYLRASPNFQELGEYKVN